MLLALLLACTPAPRPVDEVVFAWAGDLSDLHPVKTTSRSVTEVSRLVLRPAFDATLNGELRLGPDLYQSWEWAPDGTQITISLDPTATWQDGEPVTSADVVAGYAEIRAHRPRSPFLLDMLPDSPNAIDPHTVAFSFASPGDRQERMIQVSQEALPAHKLATHTGGQLLSSGRWQVVSNEMGLQVTLEPNPVGPEPVPKVDRLVFKRIDDQTSALQLLRRGEVDYVDGIRPLQARQLLDYPEIALYREPFASVEYVVWNTTRPLVADPAVRRAIATAVDVPKILDAIYRLDDGPPGATQAVGTLSPRLAAHDPALKPLPFDPPAAVAELAGLGWRDTNADGVLDKDGQPLKLEVLVRQGHPTRELVATMLQAQLKHVGVALDLVVLPTTVYRQYLADRNFDGAIYGLTAGVFPELTPWTGPSEGVWPRLNFGHYRSPAVDATRMPNTPMAEWRGAEAAIYQDQPALFLGWVDRVFAVDADLAGVQTGTVQRLQSVHEWSYSW